MSGKIISSYKFPPRSELGGWISKFDWEKMCDGQIRVFVQGEDYDCAPSSLRTQFIKHARKRGKHSNVHVDGAKVYMQADRPLTEEEIQHHQELRKTLKDRFEAAKAAKGTA